MGIIVHLSDFDDLVIQEMMISVIPYFQHGSVSCELSGLLNRQKLAWDRKWVKDVDYMSVTLELDSWEAFSQASVRCGSDCHLVLMWRVDRHLVDPCVTTHSSSHQVNDAVMVFACLEFIPYYMYCCLVSWHSLIELWQYSFIPVFLLYWHSKVLLQGGFIPQFVPNKWIT